ncbi:MAG: ABC transporter ATP-binding protein, partial [Christensenellaceae bacterium]
LGFDCLSFNRTGRVVRIVVRGNAEEIEAKLRALNPLFIEEISVDFEELFSCEVESRGYLK